MEALPEETPETFAFLDVLHAAAKYYPEDVYVVGNTTSDFDLSSSFSNDNLLISILTIVFVILLLGDVIIEKTAITLKHTGVLHAHAGAMRVHGHVRGYVSGMMDADFILFLYKIV